MNIRKLFFVVCISALLVVSGYLVNNFLMDAGVAPKCNITVHAAGTPDSLGNCIISVSFYQNGTGEWKVVATVVSSNYSSMVNMSINSGQWTLINTITNLNASLASSIPDAISKTAIYINVTGVAVNAVPLACSGTLSGSFWRLGWWWTNGPAPSTTPIWLPAADANYTVSVLYRAYY